jgi:hypothetical protein
MAFTTFGYQLTTAPVSMPRGLLAGPRVYSALKPLDTISQYSFTRLPSGSKTYTLRVTV